MNGVEIRGLEELQERMNTMIEALPEKRRSLHARLAVRLKEEVDDAIGMRIQDEEGHVRAWQAASVGSGGGYAAVRPQKGETGPESPGAITNYLENGHRIRGGQSRARAFRFYAEARSRAKEVALEEAERFAAEMGEVLS